MLERAGLVPPDGIVLASGKASQVRLSHDQRAILQTPRRNSLFGYECVRHGIRQSREFTEAYVLDQPLDHLPEWHFEEFLDRSVLIDRHRLMGHFLLMHKTVVAVNTSGFQRDFSAARRHGLLDPRVVALGVSAASFVKDYLLEDRGYQERVLMPRLADQLRAELNAA